ncbi:NAD(P)-binding domain-containing protein [Thalassobaculum salexigens]|uniref:NAD(P)-binding domain-containing protein n=1 Tax=Thalassobaculum salexigens TaxID=455360 RepID=UPI00248F45AB|nr:NAD(P)-binding domain-containing protein [Thalassobaculum salexigens]
MTDANAHYRMAIVGSGPGGLSSACRAAEMGDSHVLLEAKPNLSNTIFRYQKGKHVMAEPGILPLRAAARFEAGTREAILDAWYGDVEEKGVNIRYEAEVTAIERDDQGVFHVAVKNGESVTADAVVLGIGVQGNPRKLGAPGEDLPGIQYTLDDPDEYRGEVIVVVGAGDAAIENAVALAKQNTVHIVNRKDEFSRAKEGKPAKAILANRSGLILISVATLQSVKHVDEIAFLLAHEYGHVAMQHPRSPQEYEKMLDDDASDGAKLSAQAIAALAGEGIGKNMLLRRHEDHADFYGFDAMRACSYNHTAANQVLQSIGDWDLEKGIFERQKELEGEMSSKENVEKGGLGSIFTGLGKAFALGAEAITHGETKDTRPSADRRQLLNFYDQEYYGGAVKFDFPAFRSRNAKWTAYKETSEWRSLVSKYGASSGR